jgi:hypothetical protein
MLPLGTVGAGDIEKLQASLETGAKPDHPSAARMPLFRAPLSQGDITNFLFILSIVQLHLKHCTNPKRTALILE